jgi:hypothetical protein
MVFLVWGGRVLNAKRLTRQDLLPFGILGAVLPALCSIGATVLGAAQALGYATGQWIRRVGPGLSKRSSGACAAAATPLLASQVTAYDRFIRTG